SRWSNPTESPCQGSNSVAPTLGSVTIVRARRFSWRPSRYSSTTATVCFQTDSKSAEGTTSGFGVTVRAGNDAQPVLATAARTTHAATISLFRIGDGPHLGP